LVDGGTLAAYDSAQKIRQMADILIPLHDLSVGFPEEESISLRTTNIIERLNKEFRRRTKPMEIVAGEQSCYTLPAFIALKMELHWRSNPLGKVAKNLPFGKQLEG
jgi:hypothetical protein